VVRSRVKAKGAAGDQEDEDVDEADDGGLDDGVRVKPRVGPGRPAAPRRPV